jgi:hypothetical protein
VWRSSGSGQAHTLIGRVEQQQQQQQQRMNAELLDTFERLVHSAYTATGADSQKALAALEPFESQPALTGSSKGEEETQRSVVDEREACRLVAEREKKRIRFFFFFFPL